MRKTTQVTLAALVCAVGWASAAHAVTVAYWRFEDKNGVPAAAGDFLQSTPAPGGTASGGNTVDLASDSSGNGNGLRIIAQPTADVNGLAGDRFDPTQE